MLAELSEAIQASNTVALRVRGLQLSQQRWVLNQTLEAMARRDFRSQLGNGPLRQASLERLSRLD